LISTYERTRKYQHEFELVSHTLYNQQRNGVNLLQTRLEDELRFEPEPSQKPSCRVTEMSLTLTPVPDN